jgi:hypothetical protein
MLVAHYIGAHRDDTLTARIGWAAVRAVQRGPWRDVTHVEAIHEAHEDGTFTIASSSLRDGGVRDKRVRLAPSHWIVVDVPQWDVRESIELLEHTRGMPYDWRGAGATVLPLRQSNGGYFCTEWVAAPFLWASYIFGPAQLCAITMSIGRDVTDEFFARMSAK